MREIGVRDLKRSLSETLRAVERGEEVRVTLRGRPVADIVPAGPSAAAKGMRSLVAQGRLTPPASVRPSRPPRLLKTARRASSRVLAERDAER